MKPQLTKKWGKRDSAATAFLRPVISRPNLHVATLSHVNKVGQLSPVNLVLLVCFN